MEVVDDEGVGMFETAARLHGIAQMWMVARQVAVDVLKDLRIVTGQNASASKTPKTVRTTENKKRYG